MGIKELGLVAMIGLSVGCSNPEKYAESKPSEFYECSQVGKSEPTYLYDDNHVLTLSMVGSRKGICFIDLNTNRMVYLYDDQKPKWVCKPSSPVKGYFLSQKRLGVHQVDKALRKLKDALE